MIKLTVSVIVDTKADNSGAAKDKNKIAADCTDHSTIRFELRDIATGIVQEHAAKLGDLKTLNNPWMSNEYAQRAAGRFAGSFIGAALDVIEEGGVIKVIYSHGGDKKCGARTMILFDTPALPTAIPFAIVNSPFIVKPTQG